MVLQEAVARPHARASQSLRVVGDLEKRHRVRHGAAPAVLRGAPGVDVGEDTGRGHGPLRRIFRRVQQPRRGEAEAALREVAAELGRHLPDDHGRPQRAQRLRVAPALRLLVGQVEAQGQHRHA